MPKRRKPEIKPGACIPWEQRIKEYPKIVGDKKVIQKAWEEIDTLAYLYIWFCLIAS